MLILPPYSRREDEQMQSSLKFSGLDAFTKASKKYLIRTIKFINEVINVSGKCVKEFIIGYDDPSI